MPSCTYSYEEFVTCEFYAEEFLSCASNQWIDYILAFTITLTSSFKDQTHCYNPLSAILFLVFLCQSSNISRLLQDLSKNKELIPNDKIL